MRKYRVVPVFAAFFALLLYEFYQFTAGYSRLVDEYYTEKIFKWISIPLKLISSALPFSLGEVLLVLLVIYLIAGFVFFIVRTVIDIVRKKPDWITTGVKYFSSVTTIGALALTLFVLFGAFNYNSVTFADKAGYELKEADVKELESLCLYLGTKAGEYRSLLEVDAEGVVDGSLYDFSSLSDKALDGYESLTQQFPWLDGFYPKAKPAFLSVIMCYQQISGIYPYIIPEAIVNHKTPIMSLPHTICHEMAHQRGFAREDEANFIAFLACINNPDPVFQYSGYYSGFNYSMNALYQYDKEAWERVAYSVDPGIYIDIGYSNDFWDQFTTPNDIVANISGAVNDGYLKEQNVTDGVHSYGRVVDLLLAEYRDKGVY